MSESAHDRDRPVGFLRKGDREYLIEGADPDWSESTERNKRYRIRERASAAILDYTLLLGELDREEREKIQSNDSVDALAFFLQTHIRDSLNSSPDHSKGSGLAMGVVEEALRAEIEKAITRAYETEDNTQTYNISVENLDLSVNITESPSIERIERQLQSGEISADVIERYYVSGKINEKELHQLTRGLGLFFDITEKQRRELLKEPVPMLVGEIPEGYVKIETSDPTMSKLHDTDILPEIYRVVFAEDKTAIVPREVGEQVAKRYSEIEVVEE
ncbi:hypothetical protein A4G99_20570 [Haladaptatus sp. R4]|uniref:hypothetical protein n=1 Tax=Haladaptatus sp. R4 TaxID=1679489 RepID=UPI0007B4D0E1|nr:hypothetical protein [Haladaptatus sp. R4]KZN26450.1 hypothetical protein A4G99_20570 [Haladaptatus sp. R4]